MAWILRSVQGLLIVFAIVAAIIAIAWVGDADESQVQECYSERNPSGLELKPDFTPPSEFGPVQTCLTEWDATKQGLTMGVVALAMGTCAIALHPIGQFAVARSKGRPGAQQQTYPGYGTGQPPAQPGQQQAAPGQPPPGYRQG